MVLQIFVSDNFSFNRLHHIGEVQSIHQVEEADACYSGMTFFFNIVTWHERFPWES
jgi:hypothetical protein